MLIFFRPGISPVRLYPTQTQTFIDVREDTHSNVIIAVLFIKWKSRNHQLPIDRELVRLWNAYETEHDTEILK